MPKSVKNKIGCLLVILIIIIFALSEIPASGAMRDWQMEFLNNELAADIQNAPLSVILEEIHRRTGIEFFLGKGRGEGLFGSQFKKAHGDDKVEFFVENVVFGHRFFNKFPVFLKLDPDFFFTFFFFGPLD